jgi:hypothetical protein
VVVKGNEVVGHSGAVLVRLIQAFHDPSRSSVANFEILSQQFSTVENWHRGFMERICFWGTWVLFPQSSQSGITRLIVLSAFAISTKRHPPTFQSKAACNTTVTVALDPSGGCYIQRYHQYLRAISTGRSAPNHTCITAFHSSDIPNNHFSRGLAEPTPWHKSSRLIQVVFFSLE